MTDVEETEVSKLTRVAVLARLDNLEVELIIVLSGPEGNGPSL